MPKATSHIIKSVAFGATESVICRELRKRFPLHLFPFLFRFNCPVEQYTLRVRDHHSNNHSACYVPALE